MPKTPRVPKSANQKRYDRDTARMRISIAVAIETWSDLENDLARLLHTILGLPAPDLGYVIYYSPSSVETRIGILNDVFSERIPVSALGDETVICWAAFYDSFRSAKLVRNKVVHGNVRGYAIGNSGKFQIRLTPPVLDPIKRKRAFKGNQMPGMSANDIVQAKNRFDELRIAANKILDLIIETRKEPYDWQASLKKLAELQAHLKVTPTPAPSIPIAQARPARP